MAEPRGLARLISMRVVKGLLSGVVRS